MSSGQVLFPLLRYQDARAAIQWLCATFGFREILCVPDESSGIRHARLQLGDGVVYLGSVRSGEGLRSPRELGAATQGLCVLVPDVDAHFERARAAGAVLSSPPYDTSFGMREYHVHDLEGHPWTFGSPLAPR